MTYTQLTPDERYMLAALRRQGCNQAEIARQLGRHRSTVGREVRRNSTRADGHYRTFTAQERTNGRRSRSRRNQRFSAEDFALIDGLVRQVLTRSALRRVTAAISPRAVLPRITPSLKRRHGRRQKECTA